MAKAHIAQTSDVITIVRDPANILGKRFKLNPSGEIEKTSAVSVSLGEAVQRHVPDVVALRDVLTEVADDSHAAIINSRFPLIPINTPFLIMSERLMKTHGIERTDKQWPAELEYKGNAMPVLGRFKEHTAPSSWLLLDRDVDEHTPERFAKMTYEEWLHAVEQIIPGLMQCARLRIHSSSSRILKDGQPQGAGNGHTWVKVADPSDIERARTTILPRALELGLAWKKPRRCRDSGEIIGYSPVTIIDQSVFTPGRLVFCGRPEVRQ